jgi:hypothetical protein
LFLLFPSILFSQQDIFNVPNLNITPEGKFFSQTQIILYPDATQCDCTIQYGLGNNQEIGVSLYNIFYPSVHKPNSLENRLNHIPYVDPVITINYFKHWDLTKNLAIGTGTKFGGNFYNGNRRTNFAYFNHFDSAYEISQVKTKIHSGFYFGNEAYLGYFTENFYPAKKNELLRNHAWIRKRNYTWQVKFHM